MELGRKGRKMSVFLEDVTFVVPTRIDTIDREKNTFLVLRYLNKFFKTNIILLEAYKKGEKPKLEYLKDNKLFKCDYRTVEIGEYFHKATLINDMAKTVKTKIIAIQDTDVILYPYQYIQAVKMILEEGYKLILPHDQRILEIPKTLHRTLKRNLSVLNFPLEECYFTSEMGKGGVVFFDTSSFKYIGMMNENMKSLGGQDDEVLYRAIKLKLKYYIINELLFHLEHDRPPESDCGCKGTPKFRNDNLDELSKVRSMNYTELIAYTDKWEWVQDVVL